MIWAYVTAIGMGVLITTKELDTANVPSYYLMNDRLFEGDIVGIDGAVIASSLTNRKKAQNGLRDQRSRWVNGVIPYYISEGFNLTQQKIIWDSMNDFSSETCIKFQPLSNDPDSILFQTTSSRDESNIGKNQRHVQVPRKGGAKPNQPLPAPPPPMRAPSQRTKVSISSSLNEEPNDGGDDDQSTTAGLKNAQARRTKTGSSQSILKQSDQGPDTLTDGGDDGNVGLPVRPSARTTRRTTRPSVPVTEAPPTDDNQDGEDPETQAPTQRTTRPRRIAQRPPAAATDNGGDTSNGLVAAVTTTTTKPKPCISKTYIGSCDDDDEACAQSCALENLISGKCEPIPKHAKIKACFCQGCAVPSKYLMNNRPSVPKTEPPPDDGDVVDPETPAHDAKNHKTQTDNLAVVPPARSPKNLRGRRHLPPGLPHLHDLHRQWASTWKQRCLTREPDFEEPARQPRGPCENIVNHQGLSCTRCYTVSGPRTIWNEQCLPSPGDQRRQFDSSPLESNDRQCRELKRGTKTCTHCTWLENGRSRWKEDCR
ncbi:hypothetical protein BV898_18934 [Hypsibius exemplaris]|uniref:Peptidase M12A domain-containing protein n=1 Tax=Hypsibius exemplaris TaxID=2072580 RepID=A0A9X6NQW9_HYPEX|nr:hypothetical protein BV898_18934 [Hypsibius exemplaris]